MSNNFKKGKFTPRNLDKYLGDVNNIIFRSSWEEQVFKFCDNNVNVINWASEEIAIPYIKPTPTGERMANYYPDLYIIYKNKDGHIVKELMEIKPSKQLSPSRAKKAQTKLTENTAYIINQLKWTAAEAWCNKRGIKFTVCTEKDIFR